jgi:Protein of unknown function (DUF3467)
MRPVELLEQHDPRKLVREGHRPKREAMVHARKRRRAKGAADHEREIAPLDLALLDEAAEGVAVIGAALCAEQAHERLPWHAPDDGRLVALGQQLELRIAREQPLIVLDVIDVGRPQPPLADHDHAHLEAPACTGCDTSLVNEQDPGAERHINIHLSPEVMGGVYANFANVSHSDYEFTVTFARVDHEVEADEVPGVVVSRVNLSPRFMRELINAMEDNYSKWRTREGIKNLPEYGGQAPEAGGEQ